MWSIQLTITMMRPRIATPNGGRGEAHKTASMSTTACGRLIQVRSFNKEKWAAQSNTAKATLWRTKQTGSEGNHKQRGRKRGARAYFGNPISADACWSVEATSEGMPVHTTS